jgi:hypothetical protein
MNQSRSSDVECKYDAKTIAEQIAVYLAQHQDERDDQRREARYAALGKAIVKRLLWLCGLVGVYCLGHQRAVTGFLEWAVRG